MPKEKIFLNWANILQKSKKIKADLELLPWKKALIFLSFVFLSLSFWVMLNMQQVYNINLLVPISYEKSPVGIVFSSQLPSYYTITVQDKGSNLLSYAFKNKTQTIVLDSKNFNEDRKALIVSNDVFRDFAKKILPPTSKLSNITPYNLEIEYSRRMKKRVPIKLNATIDYKIGFQQSDTILLNPDSISLFANEKICNQIDFVETKLLNIKDADKTIDRIIQIDPIKDVSFEKEYTHLIIPIEEFTSFSKKVKITCPDLPKEYILRTFPPEVEIIYSLPVSRFKEIKQNPPKIEIPFNFFEKSSNGKVPVEISNKPNWVKNTTIKPKEIEFIIEKK